MEKKKRRLTNSQSIGIIWITVVLIALLAVIFFSKTSSSKTTPNDSIFVKERVALEKIEDSVYRSRKPHYPLRRHHKNHPKRVSQTPQNDFYTHEPPIPTRKPLNVELNHADTTTLTLLSGIGPTFARRIIKYRERLGGFYCPEQLLEVYGFTPKLLNHIAPYLTIDTNSLQKISINTMTLKQLIKHPYMDYYFARDLVNLRSRGATFTTPDDLRTIPTCTDTMLAKLLPYLEF